MCQEFIEALEKCHATGWNRLIGACNTKKDELNRCLRSEVCRPTKSFDFYWFSLTHIAHRQNYLEQGNGKGKAPENGASFERVSRARIMIIQAGRVSVRCPSEVTDYLMLFPVFSLQSLTISLTSFGSWVIHFSSYNRPNHHE